MLYNDEELLNVYKPNLWSITNIYILNKDSFCVITKVMKTCHKPCFHTCIITKLILYLKSDKQLQSTIPMFTVVDTQPTIWWHTGQSHVSKHNNPKVGCLHLSVQFFPLYPAGQSSEWNKNMINFNSNKNCKCSLKLLINLSRIAKGYLHLSVQFFPKYPAGQSL